MSCLSGTVAGPCGPEDISDLQQGGLHDASAVDVRLVADEASDLVERTGHGPHRPRRYLGIERGVVELRVAEEPRTSLMRRRPGRNSCQTGSARMCACSVFSAARRSCLCRTI